MKKSKDPAIQISNLSKKYSIGGRTYGTLRYSLSNMFKKKEYADFWALDKVSLNIDEGESIGVIGRNGAGKSTLLKILSKITYPTSGFAELNGRVASLLEVGTGFHPELTGRENIYLNGSLLGMTRKEIHQKFDEIVDFSGIEKFIDTPVKHFSSGMYVRLAFSVAAHLETEILLVDEILAVGDYEFQQKCLKKLDYSAGQKTVVFVSHDLNVINQLCDKTVWLENGRVKAFSDTDEVIKAYKDSGDHELSNHVIGNKKAFVALSDNSVARSNSSHSLSFIITNLSTEKLSNLRLDIGIDDISGKRVGWLTTNKNRVHIEANGELAVNFNIDKWVYKTGKYSITTYLENEIGLIAHQANMDTIFTQSRKEDLYKLPPDNQGSILLQYKIEY